MVFVVCITVFKIPEDLEIIAEDNFYQKPGTIPNQIKIIAIDETTLQKLGSYSEWDRGIFAGLIEMLNFFLDARPEIIGMDVILSGTNNSDVGCS